MSIFYRKRAQSLIEYTTMASLVTVGILFMGPYVIRSINALFKGSEDDITSAYREKITQGPSVTGVPGCQCGSTLDPDGCGGGNGLCNVRQMHRAVHCTPEGCQAGLPGVWEDCVWDDSCCTDWAATNHCGSFADPARGTGGHIPGGCPSGEGEYVRYCGLGPNPPGTGNPQYVCQSACSGQPGCPDPAALCEYYCTRADGSAILGDPPTDFSNSHWCTDDWKNLTAADDGLVVASVSHGGCTGGRKCEVECYDTYEAVGAGGVCQCPGGYYDPDPPGDGCIVAPCDPGWFQRGPVVGSCARGSCPVTDDMNNIRVWWWPEGTVYCTR